MREASEAGCTFVCPQLQSFNASLPCNQFDGCLQATSVIEHKVVIAGAELQADVFINGRKVEMGSKTAMADFEKDKQVRSGVWISLFN
jgi:hypothetical protein